MIRKSLQKLYLALIFIILYAPIVTLMVLSFNESRTRAKSGVFTLKWYKELFQNEQIDECLLYNSGYFSCCCGSGYPDRNSGGYCYPGNETQVAYLLYGSDKHSYDECGNRNGCVLMLLFIAVGMKMGFGTILIAHITFNIPYVILSVMPKLKQTNRHVYEAAMDLGASPLEAFFKVVFPDIVPGVLSGFMLAFTMSLDDFVITHFTKGPGIDTLSTKIYTEVRKGIKPEIYALSTIMFVTVLVLLILINYSPEENEETKTRKKRVKHPSKIKKILLRRVIPVAICAVFLFRRFLLCPGKQSCELQKSCGI